MLGILALVVPVVLQAEPDPGVRESLGKFSLGMSYEAFQKVAGTPSEAALLKHLRSHGGEAPWAKYGIAIAYFVAKEGNFTVRLTEAACKKQLKSLAPVHDHEDLCTFAFSKPNHRQPYRLSLASVRFERSDFRELIHSYFERYGEATVDRSDPARNILWRFQVENNRYEARVVASETQGFYRFELTARDLFAGGVRYGRELKRTQEQEVGVDRHAGKGVLPH